MQGELILRLTFDPGLALTCFEQPVPGVAKDCLIELMYTTLLNPDNSCPSLSAVQWLGQNL